MIRLVLAAGPQRARDVREWVCAGSGYSPSKVYEVAARMEEHGDLYRDLWSLELTPQERLLQSLEARIPREAPPPLRDALPEIIEREWRELRGEDL